MKKTLQFDEDNNVVLTNEELLSFLLDEKKVTIILGNGFTRGSDTEDVFRGIYGDIGFEENVEMLDAMEIESSVKHTFFLSNAHIETPFNEKGNVRRLINDSFWTSVLLHDKPLKNGLYASVEPRVIRKQS